MAKSPPKTEKTGKSGKKEDPSPRRGPPVDKNGKFVSLSKKGK